MSRKEACLSALFCIAGPELLRPLLHITESRLPCRVKYKLRGFAKKQKAKKKILSSAFLLVTYLLMVPSASQEAFRSHHPGFSTIPVPVMRIVASTCCCWHEQKAAKLPLISHIGQLLKSTPNELHCSTFNT